MAYFKDDSPGKVADLALEAEIERIDEWENARAEFKLDAQARWFGVRKVEPYRSAEGRPRPH